MKRLLSLIIIAALCFAGYLTANASDEQSLLTYTISKSSGAGGSTLIPITTIIPGKSRILGWDVGPAVTGSGVVAASIHDAANTTIANTTTQFGELSCSNSTVAEKWYAYPRGVSSGIVVNQANGTVATVYYENRLP
jgi:hypothetical protein